MSIENNVADPKPVASSCENESNWTCLTCNTINSDGMFCLICGTRRGTDRSDELLPKHPPCRAWFSCPKCGLLFEIEGQDFSDIKFGTCTRCQYSPDESPHEKARHNKTFISLLKRFLGKNGVL